MKDIAAAKGAVQQLLEMGKPLEAVLTLEKAVQASLRYQEVIQLERELLPLFPRGLFPLHPKLALLAARVWCEARRPGPLLEALGPLLEHPNTLPATKVYLGWAWLHSAQAGRALALSFAPGELDAHHAGLWSRFRAEAKFRLSDPTWSEEMAQAKRLLTGLALGRCLLEEGTLLSLKGQLGRARGIWAEAIVQLAPDPYYCAWAHYNIGIALQFSEPRQAEGHFLEAEALSSEKAKSPFRARALCGLAGVRRQLGDWQRALDTYGRAAKAPGDPTDRLEALWGQGFMLRLLGQPERALQALREGQSLKLPGERWIHADVAAVKLMLGDLEGSREALEQADDLGERSSMLVRVVTLEQMRLRGEPLPPLGLPLELPWLAFEAHCFPGLFEALGIAEVGRRMASPIATNRVSVAAADALKVSVNGRPLELPPKVGELLVRLLEGGGVESSETLMDDLYPSHGYGKSRQARQALWELGDRLRAILGWEDSLESQETLYRLDPSAVWDYDMPKLPPARWGNFLRGSTADWVEERRRRASD